jgi:hypothetical protein
MKTQWRWQNSVVGLHVHISTSGKGASKGNNALSE